MFYTLDVDVEVVVIDHVFVVMKHVLQQLSLIMFLYCVLCEQGCVF